MIVGAALARLLSGALWVSSAAMQGFTVDIGGVPVRPLEYGDIVTSKLTPVSSMLQDTMPGEVWMFPGEAGECVLLSVLTPNFAPVVELHYAGPNGPRLAYDEGYPGGSLTIGLQLPSTGTYFIVAKADVPADSGGEYALGILGGPTCPPDGGALPLVGS